MPALKITVADICPEYLTLTLNSNFNSVLNPKSNQRADVRNNCFHGADVWGGAVFRPGQELQATAKINVVNGTEQTRHWTGQAFEDIADFVTRV